MAEQKISRRFLSALLLLTTATLLNLGYMEACHAGLWPFAPSSPEEEAYEKSREDFKTVQDGVAVIGETASGALEDAKKIEGEIAALIRKAEREGRAVPPAYKDALRKAKECQKSLGVTAEIVEKFGDYSGKITTAMDVAEEISQVHDRAVANEQAFGELGGALSLMADAMRAFGEKVPVPVMGEIISGYGKITSGTLDKLRQVSASIQENIDQGYLGTVHNRETEKGKIFEAFRAEHGDKLREAAYAPSSPAYLYVPAGVESAGYSVLWDEEAKQFTLVPSNMPVKNIYRMNLLLERDAPPKAAELKTMMVKWNTDGAPKLKTARNLLSKLNGLFKGTFTGVATGKELGSENILDLVTNKPEVFEARYVYDTETREKVHRSIKQIHDDLMKDGSDPAKAEAAKIRNWANAYKLGIAFNLPAEPPKPEKKAVKKEEPSILDDFINAVVTEIKKPAKDKSTTRTAPPPEKPKETAKPAEVTPAAKPTAPAKPAVKPGGVVGTCRECADSGLDCACGKAACRCCAPGDSNCNAFDL